MRRVPLGLLIRRKRTERGLSQQKLASALGVSQALVSYYENGRAIPAPAALEQLGRALELSGDELKRAVNPDILGETQAETRGGPPRSAFLATLDALPGRVATFDQPAGEDGGDLAFAVDLRSHVYLVVIDAEGSGPSSAPFAQLAAACAFGATVVPGGGVVAPEDIVDATLRFWRLIDASPHLAALSVMSFERRSRRVRQCRLGMPPPFVRSGRLAHWTGKPEGPAGSFVAEMTLSEDALLLIATDGVAHLPTKGESALWNAPDLRTFLSRATDPTEVIAMLTKRAGEPAPSERVDDRLAIAVMPWQP